MELRPYTEDDLALTETIECDPAMMKDLGFVKNVIDVQRHADLSIVEEAARRLK